MFFECFNGLLHHNLNVLFSFLKYGATAKQKSLLTKPSASNGRNLQRNFHVFKFPKL